MKCQAEALLAIVDGVVEEGGLDDVLKFLANEATKYSVDKSGYGVGINAYFPDGSFLDVVLDDAGYIENIAMHY